ncbi:MAG: parallel beta-helix domain-containing protein [Pseudohongiellaceae bacterium]
MNTKERSPSPRHQSWRVSTWLSLALLIGAGLASCGPGNRVVTVEDVSNNLQLALLDARPGDIIELPAGTFAFDRGLTLTVDDITLRGAGMDETILDFSGQVSGAEGLLVTASDFTIEDIGIEDTRGDALKVRDGERIIIRRVRTEWTNGPDTDNGAYGIYPVQTRHTLIEDSVAIGASDAGIYVGQSENVIVRGNRASLNVAGIEIENTVGADVLDNVATDNTGGILVFNMPNLPMEGHSTRVFGNQVIGNNTMNFAPPGTAVSSVPPGSGIIINSNDGVEIFDNDIAGNNTGNILVSSYFSVGYSPREATEVFDPYPEGIFIHDNRFGPAGQLPGRPELEALKTALFGANGRLPDILWDGIVNPERTAAQPPVCVREEQAQVLNMDAGNDGANARVAVEEHACQFDALPIIELPHV